MWCTRVTCSPPTPSSPTTVAGRLPQLKEAESSSREEEVHDDCCPLPLDSLQPCREQQKEAVYQGETTSTSTVAIDTTDARGKAMSLSGFLFLPSIIKDVS